MPRLSIHFTNPYAIETLDTSPDLEIDIVGLFDDRFDDSSPRSIRAYKKLGKISELSAFAREQRSDLIIVAIPLSAEARLLQILKWLWELPVDIRISGQASKLKLSPRAYAQLGNLPLLAVFDRPLTGGDPSSNRRWTGPSLCSSSRFCRPSSSPRRSRSGSAARDRSCSSNAFNDELIEVYKLRSMRADPSNASAVRLVSKGDPSRDPVSSASSARPRLTNCLNFSMCYLARFRSPDGARMALRPRPRMRSMSKSPMAISPATG